MQDTRNLPSERNHSATRLGRGAVLEDRILDDAVRLATSITAADFAAITLVGVDRIWFAATSGFTALSTERAGSFCDRTVTTAERVVIDDALEDPQLCNATFVVGGLCMRFYAGIPLTTRMGQVIGTFCIASRQPALRISEDQYLHLSLLAQMSIDRLEQLIAGYERALVADQAREIAATIASEASAIANDAAHLLATASAHEIAVDAAIQDLRQLVSVDRELHDTLIGVGRPATPSKRIAGLPGTVESQIGFHETISVSVEDQADRLVGSAAAFRSRSKSFETQGQRLIDLVAILEDKLV